MLKHLPRSGMKFLPYIFNLSWSLHSFPFIWKTSFIIPIHKLEKPLDSPVSFRPISLISSVSKPFERIILWRLLFFLKSNYILFPLQIGRFSIKFCIFLSLFRMSLTNPGRGLEQFLLRSTSLPPSSLPPSLPPSALLPHPRLQTSYPHLPILYLFPLPPHHRPLLLAVLLRLLPPLPS